MGLERLSLQIGMQLISMALNRASQRETALNNEDNAESSSDR